MTKIKFDLENICSFIFVLIALILASGYYQGNTTLSSEGTRVILKYFVIFLMVVSMGLVFIPLLKKRNLDDFNVLSILPIVFLFIISNLHVYYEGKDALSNIHIITWITFCFASKNVKQNTFVLFKKIFIIICILGILAYIAYLLKLPLNYDVLPYYGNNVSLYIKYPFAVIQGSLTAPRLCCIYNEPGFLGTICALTLCADKINLKNKSNIIILIAGICSVSFAFFLILLVYLLLNSWRKWKYFAVVLVCLIAYLLVLPNIHTNNKQIDNFLSRFTITESGIAGDNRTSEEFDIAFENVMLERPLFGMGNGYMNQFNGTSSIKAFIIEYGIFGTLLIYGILLVSVVYKNTHNRDVIVYIITFFISLYQRPNIFMLQYEVLLFGAIPYLLEIQDRIKLTKK